MHWYPTSTVKVPSLTNGLVSNFHRPLLIKALVSNFHQNLTSVLVSIPLSLSVAIVLVFKSTAYIIRLIPKQKVLIHSLLVASDAKRSKRLGENKSLMQMEYLLHIMKALYRVPS